jgi:lysophospholipase L1-like esterase
MRAALPLAALIGAVVIVGIAVGCGGGSSPTTPTPPAATLSRTKFLAFGDSFTAGEVTSPIGSTSVIGKLIIVPAVSYPTVLQGQLTSAYPSQSSAIVMTNAGVPGEQLLEGLARFDTTFSASGANVVMIQEGANGLRLVGPDTSTGIVRIMVQSAKTGGARVFVGSMIPTVPGRPRANVTPEELVTYNDRLQLMSQQEGVTYVDLYGAMLPDAANLIGSDGLHPTEAGYRKMAETFFTAIRAQLETR